MWNMPLVSGYVILGTVSKRKQQGRSNWCYFLALKLLLSRINISLLLTNLIGTEIKAISRETKSCVSSSML